MFFLFVLFVICIITSMGELGFPLNCDIVTSSCYYHIGRALDGEVSGEVLTFLVTLFVCLCCPI